MVSTVKTNSEDVRQEDRQEELALRICGSTRDGQIVRLRAGKCTIGSGPRCTLRLRAQGVRPLHCLILRGSRATVIRSWAPDTRLNGRAFHDAQLNVGDRLSIGPIELEVLPGGPLENNVTEFPGRLPGPLSGRDDPKQEIDASQNTDTSALSARLAHANRQSHTRARRLLRQLRAARRQITQLQTQHKRALAEQSDRVAGVRDELQSVRQALDEQRRQWDTERTEAEGQLHARAEELDSRQAELDSGRRDFEADRQRWDTERTEAEGQLHARAEELDSRQAELDSGRRDFEADRQRWNAERTEAEGQLHARAEKLDSRQGELDSGRSTPIAPAEESDHEAVAPQAGQPDEIQFEAPSADSPGSTQEILGRLGAVPSLVDDEDEQDEDAPSVAPQPTPEPASDASKPEDDETIDDYMAQLMSRVENATGNGERPPEPSPRAEVPAKTPPAAAEAAPKTFTSQPEAAKEAGPVKMAPRAPAPENPVDLSAMRELANLSAHTAIDHHSRRMLSRAVNGKLLVALLGLATGVGLWWIRASSELVAYAAMAGFVVALLWGAQYAGLVSRMFFGIWRRRSLEPTIEDVADNEPAEDDPSLPG